MGTETETQQPTTTQAATVTQSTVVTTGEAVPAGGEREPGFLGRLRDTAGDVVMSPVNNGRQLVGNAWGTARAVGGLAVSPFTSRNDSEIAAANLIDRTIATASAAGELAMDASGANAIDEARRFATDEVMRVDAVENLANNARGAVRQEMEERPYTTAIVSGGVFVAGVVDDPEGALRDAGVAGAAIASGYLRARAERENSEAELRQAASGLANVQHTSDSSLLVQTGDHNGTATERTTGNDGVVRTDTLTPQ